MGERHSQVLQSIAAALIVAVCLSCGAPPRESLVPEQYRTVSPDRVLTVDAYLFDARIWRDGKPTSVRLELYETDSLIGFTGRGYLGKGALRGQVTADTILAYFPSSNEYLFEPVTRLFNTAACSVAVNPPDMFKLLSALPEPGAFPGAVTNRHEQGDKERSYSVAWANCPWHMDLDYDFRDDRWRIVEFRFRTDEANRIVARRRVFERQTTINYSRFDPAIDTKATRIGL